MTAPADDSVESEVLDGEVIVTLSRSADGLPDELPLELAAELDELIADAERYAAAAQASNTTRAYTSDWRQFTAWCERYRMDPLPAPPAVLALYVTSLARRGLAVSTIRRRVAAIARAHRQAGHLSATRDAAVLTILEGIGRLHGTNPKKKTALLRDPLLDVVDRIDVSTSAGLRDRALLLLGFAVGLRRSELVALEVQDLSPSPDGLRIRIRRSKTDQQATGTELLVAYAVPPRPCAVRALRAWIDHAELTSGPIFRRVTRTGAVSIGSRVTPTGPVLIGLSAQSVALIIKKRARAAGLDPAEFAGHSLRSGYATQAARDGHHQAQIADITRHQDERVLAGYIHAGRGAKDTATVL